MYAPPIYQATFIIYISEKDHSARFSMSSPRLLLLVGTHTLKRWRGGGGAERESHIFVDVVLFSPKYAPFSGSCIYLIDLYVPFLYTLLSFRSSSPTHSAIKSIPLKSNNSPSPIYALQAKTGCLWPFAIFEGRGNTSQVGCKLSKKNIKFGTLLRVRFLGI